MRSEVRHKLHRWVATAGVSIASVVAVTAPTIASPNTAYAVDNLSGSQSLAAGQSITSSSGQYQFVMQGDGNLVLYFSGRAIWASGTWGNSGARAVMQGDGNLVVYSSAGRALWNSGTWGNSGARLWVQSDGNVVIYASSGRAIWATNTYPQPALTANQVLRAGQYIYSSGATYQLWMQGDGNLVLYSGGRALWASGTWGNSGAYAVMQGDGNLVVYSSAGRALWSSGTWGNSGARAIVQSDGNFVVYASNGQALWSVWNGRVSGGAIGDDYPYKTASMNAADPWNFYYRNCTSFAAWRLNSANGVGFSNSYGGLRWGNANTWDDAARSLGIPVNGSPRRGAIAQTDAGSWGHVAWVAAVNADGTVTIEEYNSLIVGGYSSRRVAAGSFQYIHIRDL